jgi:hypothetical protein
MAPDRREQQQDKPHFPSPGATIGLLALVVLLIWLVAGLMVLLGASLGLIDWGDRPAARS